MGEFHLEPDATETLQLSVDVPEIGTFTVESSRSAEKRHDGRRRKGDRRIRSRKEGAAALIAAETPAGRREQHESTLGRERGAGGARRRGGDSGRGVRASAVHGPDPERAQRLESRSAPSAIWSTARWRERSILLPGETAASSLFLVYDLPANLPQGLPLGVTLYILGVEAIEVDLPVTVEDHQGHNDQSGCWGANQATAGVLDELLDRTPAIYYGTTAWQGYLIAAGRRHRPRAGKRTARSGATGAAKVAIIDTGVDRSHPTLQPFLTEGFDFTRDVDGGDEVADVDQATAGVLDGLYGMNQSTVAALDQATAGVLDDTDYSHFGHGTMVAGVVHLVAPTAQIMPLKAFSASGQGYTSDIVRAIHYAVRKGAKVLNMSFSRSTSSNELRRAINFASDRGLIAVASAGNDGQSSPKYPAAWSNVMAVASTTNDDTRSTLLELRVLHMGRRPRRSRHHDLSPGELRGGLGNVVQHPHGVGCGGAAGRVAAERRSRRRLLRGGARPISDAGAGSREARSLQGGGSGARPLAGGSHVTGPGVLWLDRGGLGPRGPSG